MKKMILSLAGVVSLAAAAETLIFTDDFKTLNFKTWQHELTMSGGGNWEFEWYVNNRTNTYVRDGILYMKPTLSEDILGPDGLRNGDINIWGGSPADMCTGNNFYGCERNGPAQGHVVNPIRSARLRTVNSLNFKYGRVEVVAKLPVGDWLWPAIWMLPSYSEYGNWPTSGEIDIMESRGNDMSYEGGGNNKFASTLHWGPDYWHNRWPTTHAEYTHTSSLGDDFHTYGLYWDEDILYTYIDDPENVVLSVDTSVQSYWEKGDFPATYDNAWIGEDKSAPFNKEFYLIMNVACGGTADYFPDEFGAKPWSNKDGHAPQAFWNAKDQWYSTWKGENAAMQIKSVNVWSIDKTAEQKE